MVKFHLPQVHPSVNILGFLTTLGLGVATFAVTNQTAIVSAVPAKDAVFVGLLISAVATLLPDKRTPIPSPPPPPPEGQVHNFA